jgi:hypothetical protein
VATTIGVAWARVVCLVMTLTRRDLLQQMGASLASASIVGPFEARRGEEQEGQEAVAPLPSRFPRMMQEYFEARVRSIDVARAARLAKITTRAQAEAYVREVRGKIARCFPGMPARTPLNAVVRGTVERERYRIEKVVFESRPGFMVTANLYVPRELRGKAPCVLGACGHSENGKLDGNYQAFVQTLARMGYVALIYDPIAQGERAHFAMVGGEEQQTGSVRVHLQTGAHLTRRGARGTGYGRWIICWADPRWIRGAWGLREIQAAGR